MGREALANKKFISAGEHLQRAGVYYHFGKFLFVHDVPQMKAAHMKAVECRNLALPHLNPPGERVTIPYRARRCTASCASRNGVAKPPVLIMAVGLDSAKEETDAYERPYLDRGIATLVFDGPGQGEGEYDFAIRGDYEVAVKAVVDYVMTRRRSRHRAHRPVGRQPRRLLRAARRGVREAHQGLPRARRAVRLAGGTGTALPELTREAFRVRSHCATQDEAKRHAANAVAEGRGAEHHLSDFRDDRQARPADPVAARASGWRTR